MNPDIMLTKELNAGDVMHSLYVLIIKYAIKHAVEPLKEDELFKVSCDFIAEGGDDPEILEIIKLLKNSMKFKLKANNTLNLEQIANDVIQNDPNIIMLTTYCMHCEHYYYHTQLDDKIFKPWYTSLSEPLPDFIRCIHRYIVEQGQEGAVCTEIQREVKNNYPYINEKSVRGALVNMMNRRLIYMTKHNKNKESRAYVYFSSRELCEAYTLNNCCITRQN